MQTGRYHQRMGLNWALGANSTIGLRQSETTIAEQLGAHGYATAMVGKWHLGKQAQFHPNNHGLPIQLAQVREMFSSRA